MFKAGKSWKKDEFHVVVVRVDEGSFENILLETENNLVNRIERRLHDNSKKNVVEANV